MSTDKRSSLTSEPVTAPGVPKIVPTQRNW